jgi:excisionase family DNA binding protein
MLNDNNGSSPPNGEHVRGVEDLARLSGPPLTTSELAHMLGMSPTFIREEIHSGHLRAVSVGRGRKRVFRIPVFEAHRYAKELGLV